MASLGVIADFRISLFDKGRFLSTLRGYLSAIAAIHAGFPDGSGVSNSPRLAMLLRSFFLERPPQQKLAPPWSLPKVLDALSKPPFEPLAKAPHPLGEDGCEAYSQAFLHCEESNCLIWSGGDLSFSLSIVSSVEEDKVRCPVRTLKWYPDRTKGIRTDEQLFLITREPFSPASNESISRWLIEAVQAAGPEALAEGVRPRAHDTRGSTSWALFHGVALHDIMKAAFWLSPNTFISCYLKDVPASEERFATASLLAALSSAADLYITQHLDKFCCEYPGMVYMVRLYAVTHQKSTIHDKVMKYVLTDEQGNLRHPYDSEISDWASYAKTQTEGSRRTPNIVIATLNTAVQLTRNMDLKEYFTHIIIDEAGQVRETEAIIPLQLATNDTCVVLAGDHKQIGPKVYSSRARSAKYNFSLLQRLFSYSRYHKCFFDLLLTHNYRSCLEILDFLAPYYNARMEALGTHPRHPLFYPLNFYVVKGEDRLMGASYSGGSVSELAP
eukprot:XP_011677811.1 PREDICTED: uncharacterized protein LOC105444801 [Strongylocentrotus purpuratus]